MEKLQVDFYGDSLSFSYDPTMQVSLSGKTAQELFSFCDRLLQTNHQALVQQLLAYREQEQLDDWLYYQVIRSVAEKLSPKSKDYHQYTLYKWLLLNASGYNASTRLRNDTLLLYVQSEEEILDIPYYQQDGKQFVCLNYHDYSHAINFSVGSFHHTYPFLNGKNRFSYQITRLPDLNKAEKAVKELRFDYDEQVYRFNVVVNKGVQKIFTNYPVVDYRSQFNIPISHTTYQSLIPVLKNAVKDMGQQKGVDYLMRFTRSAFAFDTDTRAFGKEKRLSPEQTLLYDYSDCEDRSAFFFYLVKEVYDLPMIVLAYPSHITVAVQFKQAPGKPIIYNGESYWVCEPTPQKKDLGLGELLPQLRKQSYEVVYAYRPNR